jgi:hypothetical protein
MLAPSPANLRAWACGAVKSRPRTPPTGADSGGRVEHEQFVDDVVIAPGH